MRLCVICGGRALGRTDHCADLLCVRLEALSRFWAGVDTSPGRGPDGECWEWIKARPPAEYRGLKVYGIGNYGSFTATIDGQRFQVASRFSQHVYNGPIPQGWEVAHSCDNPPCCRPDHLSAKTQAENMADRCGKSDRPSSHGYGWLQNEHGIQIYFSCVPNHPTPAQVAEWKQIARFDSVRWLPPYD